MDKKRVNEFGFSGDDEVTDGAVDTADTAVKEEEKKTN